MTCANNLRSIGLAVHNYHDTHNRLPTQLTGTFDPHSDRGGFQAPHHNQRQLSGFVGLLPFMEQQPLREQIRSGDETWSPMGPPPWVREYDPWQTEVSLLRCRADGVEGLPAHGRTNYAFCLGDAVHWLNTGPTRFVSSEHRWVTDRRRQVDVSGRGCFVPRRPLSFRDITDGLNHTAMLGEILTHDESADIRTCGHLTVDWSDVLNRPNLVDDEKWRSADQPMVWCPDSPVPDALAGRPNDQRRGYRWADGAALYTGFNTILPPNREIFLAGGDAGIGMLPPSSRHPGGVHIAMADASVQFVSDSIDAGDPAAPTVQWHPGEELPAEPVASPYGVWGAMGTRAAEESPSETKP